MVLYCCEVPFPWAGVVHSTTSVLGTNGEAFGLWPCWPWFRGWPDLPCLGSLNTFQMDTLMQNGQFLNIYYTWQKLYLLYLSLGCFLHWKLFEHYRPQLVCFEVFLSPVEFSFYLPVELLLIP